MDRRLEHGDDGRASGTSQLEVVHLRGHTPGLGGARAPQPGDGSTHVLTGDSLFPGGVGNTGGDAERFTRCWTTCEQRLFAVLPDDAVVHPGHGEGTTIGAERPQLGAWRERGW